MANKEIVLKDWDESGPVRSRFVVNIQQDEPINRFPDPTTPKFVKPKSRFKKRRKHP